MKPKALKQPRKSFQKGDADLKRYIGLDVHKNFIMIAAVDRVQETIMAPRKVKMTQFDDWIAGHITPEDTVTLEVSNGSWEIHDRLRQHTRNILVANSNKLKIISRSSVKTDKRDAMVLARLTSVNILPTIWVPPAAVRELRSLIAQRKNHIKMRTRVKNRMHGILMRRHIQRPMKSVFSDKYITWWQSLPLTKVEKLQVKQGLEQIQFLKHQIIELEECIGEMSVESPWKEQVVYVLQIVGIGLMSAMTILSAIGDVHRFSTAKALVGYSGLGSRVHASGDSYRTGKISKTGRKELRTALVECAWVAIRFSDHWRLKYEELIKRKDPQKAITIIARKMLVVIWHVLTKKVKNKHITVETIARKMLKWAMTYRLATKQGGSRPAFVRRELDRLGVGRQLKCFIYGNRHFILPDSQFVS